MDSGTWTGINLLVGNNLVYYEILLSAEQVEEAAGMVETLECKNE